MAAVTVVDILVQLKASSFEPRFTYQIPADQCPLIGAVVRIPFGKKHYYGYCVSRGREVESTPKLKQIEEIVPLPAAFTADGLELAQWLAHTYCCTLSEAIGTMVYANAIPRTVEKIVPLDRARAADKADIPERLLDFLFSDALDGIALEELLRHPEARRAADRPTLRKSITRLVGLGAVRRERTATGPLVRERLERQVRIASSVQPDGAKLKALYAYVHDHDGARLADVVKAGFSRAVVTRAVAEGAIAIADVAVPSFYTDFPNPEKVDAHHAIIPTAEQAAALDTLDDLRARHVFSETLLHGITGSGKTYVYLEAVRRALVEGLQAIILVPEIALTPQTAGRFQALFGNAVAVLHSGLSDRARFDAWRAAARGDVKVVVGARSAVFVPLPNLGVIVVDEAHESTYRQDQTPRYSALSVARERMRMRQGMLILGSATPPLDVYARAKLGQIGLISLYERATKAPLPTTEILDLSAQAREGNRSIFGTPLIIALEQCLQAGEKAVLFVNHRGAARFLLCRSCGFVPTCARCSLSLTLHRAEGVLRCHLCDAQEPVPTPCARCKKTPMAALGLGTERVVTELLEIFPRANIVRMDSDTTTRNGDHARLLDLFATSGDFLVGTQMIAKGLDFPTVTVAAVVAADTGLHIADYRASERTFSLLTQVAGRSGRQKAGRAFIQTYLPDHPAVVFAAAHDYEGFARGELSERRILHYPPFVRLTYVTLAGRNRDRVQVAANAMAERFRAGEADWEILGPAFAPVPRINEEWRIRVAIKTTRLEPLRDYIRSNVLPAMRNEEGVRAILEIDV